ncbi:MAG: porin, partial [Rhizobiaceae bacterium]|nr:porin [Rhizobiaceae bacterium]
KMKLKSLLIGSAAVMAVSTGSAKAADAIVMAEPEPMEYVRICDVYGAGFYYIPGTETCMKIGGYFRYELGYHRATSATSTVIYNQVNAAGNFVGPFAGYGITRTNPAGLNHFFRFAPTIDVRSETALGTLRGFARVYFDYGWTPSTIPSGFVFGTSPAVFPPGPGMPALTGTLGGSYGTTTSLNQGYIELIRSGGTFRVGLGDSPYLRFLGYGGYTMNDGRYGGVNSVEISYTFAGSNGFSGIIALVEDGRDSDWAPMVEGGFNFAQGWGSFGIMAGYDTTPTSNSWGAKAVLRANLTERVSATLQVFYSNPGGGIGAYTIMDHSGTLTSPAGRTTWSVLGSFEAAFTEKAALQATAQWFDTGNWFVAGGLNLTPAENFSIRPEITYQTTSTAASGGGATWGGRIRLQRDIP